MSLVVGDVDVAAIVFGLFAVIFNAGIDGIVRIVGIIGIVKDGIRAPLVGIARIGLEQVRRVRGAAIRVALPEKIGRAACRESV